MNFVKKMFLFSKLPRHMLKHTVEDSPHLPRGVNKPPASADEVGETDFLICNFFIIEHASKVNKQLPNVEVYGGAAFNDTSYG